MHTDLTAGISEDREFFHAKSPDEREYRDALNVWIEEEHGAFGMRIGVEAVSTTWETPEIYLDVAFPDGRVISRRSREAKLPALDGDGRPAILGGGPLRFQCVEPFRRWKVFFDGDAPWVTAADLIATPYPDEGAAVPVEFEIDLTMAVPAWVAGSLIADAADALEHGGQADFISPRYEQLFRAAGEIRIGDERRQFKGQGLRVRREGFRKFEGFWGHCWMSALFPSGKAFGFNIFPPKADGSSSFGEGFVFDGSGTLRPARPVVVPWLRELQVSGDRVPLELETSEGRVRIEATSFINTRGRFSTELPANFPADFPIIQQSHATFVWDGETATGMMERSTPPSQLRNYKHFR